MPTAVLYVGKCTVAALCQEESCPSRNLDSPSARAKDDCFIGLWLQVGPCSGLQIPRGDFRDTEGGRRTPLVCTALDSSPLFSLRSLPLRNRPPQWPRESAGQTNQSCTHGPFPSQAPRWAGCLSPEPSPPGVSFFLWGSGGGGHPLPGPAHRVKK